MGKGILEDKILKILSLSQLSVTVHVQVLVGSSFDPNSGFSHLSPQRFCQGYFSDGSGSKVSLLCLFIMVNSVCVSKMMRHQILLVIYHDLSLDSNPLENEKDSFKYFVTVG